MKLASLLLVALPAIGAAQGGEASEDVDLAELSLDELMNIEVTIASKTKQRLSDTPAAVYVLSGDEIRRAGHSSIPEALRMVPGFYVSHWTTGAWDVTSRGFGPGLSLTSLAFLNQLLVVIDGVVMYTPLFAGTWWPLQDIDMADIDRIEVVRGPGGILWGANAVHGVVHIITKDAANTQGPRVTLRGGTDDRHGSARYGGPLDKDNGYYRAWVKYSQYDTQDNPFDGFSQDWEIASGGFRADWERAGRDVTLWARAYQFGLDQRGFDLTTFVPIPVRDTKQGFQTLLSVANPDVGSRLQASFSTDQQDLPTLLNLAIDQVDVDYQRQIDMPYGSSMTVGAGYHLTHHELVGDDPFFLDFDPQEGTRNVFRAFAVDTIELGEDVTLTLGLTAEHNDFTQFELQPTGRLAWWLHEDVMAWASVSRAVRTPSIEENDLTDSSVFIGNDGFKSETLIAYEAGARALLGDSVSVDVAGFYNDYDDLHFELFDPVFGQFLLTNDAEGRSYGVEVALDVRPTERWSLRSAYSLLRGDYESKIDGSSLGTEDQSPRHQFNLRSYYDLGNNWELDSAVYVVEGLGSAFEIAEHVRGDARVGWHPSEALELFAGVQSFNDRTHSEFDQFDNVRRSFFFGLDWSP